MKLGSVCRPSLVSGLREQRGSGLSLSRPLLRRPPRGRHPPQSQAGARQPPCCPESFQASVRALAFPWRQGRAHGSWGGQPTTWLPAMAGQSRLPGKAERGFQNKDRPGEGLDPQKVAAAGPGRQQLRGPRRVRALRAHALGLVSWAVRGGPWSWGGSCSSAGLGGAVVSSASPSLWGQVAHCGGAEMALHAKSWDWALLHALPEALPAPPAPPGWAGCPALGSRCPHVLPENRKQPR